MGEFPGSLDGPRLIGAGIDDVIDAMERALVKVALDRAQRPQDEASFKLLLARLERDQVWKREAVPARIVRVVEDLLIANSYILWRAPREVTMTAMTSAFLAARIIAYGYESMGQRGVLEGLTRLEASFTTEEGILIPGDDTIDAAAQLVAALKFQDEKKSG